MLTIFGLVAFVPTASAAVSKTPLAWASAALRGNVTLKGQVPLAVANLGRTRHSAITSIGRVVPAAPISLSFGLPLRNATALNALIVAEAKTHREMSRADIYARFSPPKAQYEALRTWLVSQGYTITHVGADRLEMTARAPAAAVQKSLGVKLEVFHGASYTDEGVNVPAQDFYANTTAPVLPARLGVQSVSGLSNIDQFFTDVQLTNAAAAAQRRADRGRADGGKSIKPFTRSGGYYPSDLQSMYDVQGTYGYGTGQTIGFTLWGAAENQAATTEFGTVTGQPALTVDPLCTATGNNATTPSSCSGIQESPNHLLNILENGNADNAYGGNAETGLDVETSHGMAPGVAEKYYLGDCSATPSPGLSNGDNCNGSDVGLEDAIEDAANDPTLHSVSDSWGYGGDAEYGTQDPFVLATQNSFAIAAAAGTTFYFSTGDDGTYESGYPADSPYVVAVGGTTLFSTQSLTSTSPPGTLSTENAWAAGGSWCSNIEPRPAWQNGAGVTANASCPGRAVPDISAIADTNSAVYEVYSTGASSYRTGSVGGTSVAAPAMNGMESDTENFIANQSYPGGVTPAIGFEGPVMYMLGNSSNYASYFRDVLCGNDADPSGGPDGASAQPGWDQATGWGAIDVTDYSTGYAMELGATGLSVPTSLAQNYQWSCAKTPGNSTEHSISFPTSSTGYAVGTAASSPWPGTYLPSRSWGATNTFYTTTNGGTDWVPSNADMLSVACTSASTCVEVGDGGVIKRTTNAGTTWTADATQFDQALTQVTCPSSTICYAAGDRGTVLSSSDGGVTWTATASADGNPIYGLSCPTTTTCYAVDNYAHVETTTNGGTTWTLSSTPVTTPGVNVPGSGGPNPYAGLFGVSCPETTTCVAVGGYPPTAITGETAPPIVTTTDGSDWSLQNSNAAAGDYLMAVSCATGTTTCYAVGYGGTIVTTTNLTTWSTMTSGTTEPLIGITCLSATSCVADGEGGTIDVLNGTTWTPSTTTLGSSAYLAGVTCLTANDCYSVGKQGVTLNYDSTNVSSTVTQQAGGGTTQTMDSISCTSASTCEAVGGAGTILGTTNGGQTWLPQASGSTATLDGVSCSGSDCVAVGTTGTILATTNGGTNWASQPSGVTVTLASAACDSGGCVVVGSAPSGGTGTILTAANGGGSWTAATSGVSTSLTGVACESSDCWAVGGIPTGTTTAAIVASTNGGTSWQPQASNSLQALSSIACADATDCFAGGAIGTVVATNSAGASWYQEGDPISGPTTALNAGPTSITAIDGAACSPAACFMATASSGNIMMTPLLTVTVDASGAYGTTPDLTGLAPSSAAISYNPQSAASAVTGGLSCSTTATDVSDAGSYPISSCSGLAANGYNVIYNYGASSYSVTQASNSIAFPSIADQTYGSGSFQIDPTASSGLAVALQATGDCSLDSSTSPANVTLTGAGSCSITASQAGDNDYAAAQSVTQSFSISQASQIIDFTTLSPHTYGDASFEIDPTATSGLTVSLSASGPCSVSSPTSPANVTITGTGQCSITASQDGDNDYTAAQSVTQSFNIALASQMITFNSLPGQTYGAGPITLGAYSSSGLPITYFATGGCAVSGNTLTIVGGGTCTVLATQPGNADYNPAPDVQQSFNIAPASQTIRFGALPGKTFGNPSFLLKATASSGLPISYSVGATDSCSVSAGRLTLTGAGSCTVTAAQDGNSDYTAAQSVSQTFQISQGTPKSVKVTATPVPAVLGSVTYHVTVKGFSGTAPTGTVTVSDGTSTCSIDSLTAGAGTCSIDESAGTYTVTASYSGDNNYMAATGSKNQVVQKAKPTVSITPSANPAPAPGNVGYLVSVTGVAGFTPAGTVIVADGNGESCDINLSGGNGSCEINEAKGTYHITAEYLGNAEYKGVSKAITERVQ
jgi:photosystem II stability/assembly factor-like uncharacterized protein